MLGVPSESIGMSEASRIGHPMKFARIIAPDNLDRAGMPVVRSKLLDLDPARRQLLAQVIGNAELDPKIPDVAKVSFHSPVTVRPEARSVDGFFRRHTEVEDAYQNLGHRLRR